MRHIELGKVNGIRLQAVQSLGPYRMAGFRVQRSEFSVQGKQGQGTRFFPKR